MDNKVAATCDPVLNTSSVAWILPSRDNKYSPPALLWTEPKSAMAQVLLLCIVVIVALLFVALVLVSFVFASVLLLEKNDENGMALPVVVVGTKGVAAVVGRL